MARMTVSNAGRAAAAVLGIALLAIASGCTMCPDPHDYSGPVPGGSTPQNDFRARSNGILPLGVAPVPWPPVVKVTSEAADPESPEAETDAAPAVAVGDAGDSAAAEELAVVVAAEADTEVKEERSAPGPEGVDPASVEEPFPDILPPPRPLRPERLPSLRESLGWKPRG